MNVTTAALKALYRVGACIFLLGLAATARAQTWTELFPSGSPPNPLFVPKPAFYDGANNRLIVFFPGVPGGDGFGNQVWILTNANGLGGAPSWIQLTAAGSPPFSNGLESVAYDDTDNRLIVYGGCAFNCSPPLDQVFVLTNANGLGGPPVWSQSSVTNPQARTQHSGVFDSINKLLIAFGGNFAFFGTDQNDTRTLTNANGAASPSIWSTLLTSGGPPTIRGQHSAFYDQANNRMTVFAGTNEICCNFQVDKNDVWVLTNANGIGATPTWTQLSPSGSLPAPRFGHSAVYDATNNRMLVFGGGNVVAGPVFLGDLWQLSNANGLGGSAAWTEIQQLGTLPGPRLYHTAAFDVVNQRMILLGGRDSNDVPSNRVWVLDLKSTPPVALCRNVTVSAGPDCTANASIDNGSFDPDSGDTITLSQSPPGPYPLGTTSVTLTVTNSHGASSQCTGTVTVIDDTPPTISDVSAAPSVLWPPNHKMVDVTINYTAADNCGPVTCLLSVTSNEPIDGTAAGNTSPDWQVVDAHHVMLRAERAGNGDGRVYTVTITCKDGKGNTSTSSVTVTVPHDQS